MNKSKEKMKNLLLDFLKDPQFKDQYYQGLNNGIHQQSIIKFPESWSSLTKDEIDIRHDYLSICSVEEIERILFPLNASDILLKLRADSVLDNRRIFRTISKRACYVKNSEWKLTNQFDDSIFEMFKRELDVQYAHKTDEIYFGTVFTDDTSGCVTKTDLGSIIIIPEALNKFLYFMNLGFYLINHKETINSENTIRDAITLAMRIMLSSEAFDFELDSRGEVPESIDSHVEEVTKIHLLFIIAHEYAHFLLNHLDEEKLIDANFFDVLPSDSDNKSAPRRVYTHTQLKEFEADKFAIEILSGNDIDKKRELLFLSSVLMSYIDIFESLKYFIKPNYPSKTHPPSNERRDKLMELGKEVWLNDEIEFLSELVDVSKNIKTSLIKNYRNHPSNFITYGSLYLSEFKSERKIDRIDY